MALRVVKQLARGCITGRWLIQVQTHGGSSVCPSPGQQWGGLPGVCLRNPGSNTPDWLFQSSYRCLLSYKSEYWPKPPQPCYLSYIRLGRPIYRFHSQLVLRPQEGFSSPGPRQNSSHLTPSCCHCLHRHVGIWPIPWLPDVQDGA